MLKFASEKAFSWLSFSLLMIRQNILLSVLSPKFLSVCLKKGKEKFGNE